MSENVEQNAPLRITISEVRNLLSQGKSRKEIANHYGKTQAEMQRMVWNHPKLKNLKAKKQYTGIELEDDIEDDVVAGIVAEIPAPTPPVTEEDNSDEAEVSTTTVNQDWI